MWIVSPQLAVSGVVLMIAGVLQAARLARWAGERTFTDRLVLVLHVGYVFVPIGFLLLGAAILAAVRVDSERRLACLDGGSDRSEPPIRPSQNDDFGKDYLIASSTAPPGSCLAR